MKDGHVWHIERIGVLPLILFAIDVGPQRGRPFLKPLVRSLFLGVTQECTKPTGIDMFEDGDEQLLVKLKATGVLLHELPDTVDELQKDGRPLRVLVIFVTMAAPG